MSENNINLNLYKIFYEVAKYGSFSKAAEFTFSTQPAISRSIKKLEQELETELFYRKADGVELTDKGKQLLFYVEKSYGNLLTAERIMLETESLNRGNLSIGIPSNLCSFLLLDKIADYHEKYPNIEITILTGTTSYLINQLNLHKVDFIIDTAPIIEFNNELTIKKIAEINYCFVTNSDEYKNIKSIGELKNVPLILPLPGTENRNMLEDLFIKNNIKLKNVLNIHTSEIIIKAVKSNMGVGYIIYDFVKEDILNNELKLLNIDEKLPTGEIDIVYNKKFLTSAPKKFIDLYISKI